MQKSAPLSPRLFPAPCSPPPDAPAFLTSLIDHCVRPALPPSSRHLPFHACFITKLMMYKYYLILPCAAGRKGIRGAFCRACLGRIIQLWDGGGAGRRHNSPPPANLAPKCIFSINKAVKRNLRGKFPQRALRPRSLPNRECAVGNGPTRQGVGVEIVRYLVALGALGW